MNDDDTPDAPVPEVPDAPDQPRREGLAPRIKSRVTLRKFEGDGTSGDPVETLEFKEEGFDEFVAELEAKERSNATD